MSHPKIDEAKTLLERVQEDYRRGLGRVDQLLVAAVCQDPAFISAAEIVRRSYADFGYEPVRLMPLNQPESVYLAEPTPKSVEKPQPSSDSKQVDEVDHSSKQEKKHRKPSAKRG